MKIMHKPEIAARIKVEEYLEKEGKELVAFAYGTQNMEGRRFYVGIAYKRSQGKDAPTDRNRYDIVVYDIKMDKFGYSSTNMDYEHALINMGQRICLGNYSSVKYVK